MKQEIHLFIDNKEVLFSEPPSILFTFQRVDYTNPTAIKNNFTKTVTVEGTPDNNKVFGEIWKLDRTQGDELFNPSKRVPFELYENGGLLETGYAKLDNIVRDGYKVSYEITLYGGLGDFFYGLSYGFDYDRYDDTVEQDKDEELKLKDLTFLPESTTDDPTELNFSITKDAIVEAWGNLTGQEHAKNKWDIVNFAPAYNGLPEDFDANKVLVNEDGYGNGVRLSVPAGATVDGTTYQTDQVIELTGFPQTIVVDGTTYTAQNGYGLSELREDLTEWEIRDLRSYLQRPVLSIKGLFEAIKRYAKEKGGYTLDLSDEFFDESNDYYTKAWITLPMLQNLNGDYAEQEAEGIADITTFTQQVDTDFTKEYSAKTVTTIYDVVALPVSTNGYKSVNFNLTLETTADGQGDDLTMSMYKYNYTVTEYCFKTEYYRVIGYDDNDNIIGQSIWYALTSNYFNNRNNSYERYTPISERSMIYSGAFRKVGNKTVFVDGDGKDVFNIYIEAPVGNTFDHFKIERRQYYKFSHGYQSLYKIKNPGADLFELLFDENRRFNYNGTNYPTGYEGAITANLSKSTVTYKPDTDNMKSYQLITKGKLLGQEGTPAKYMIDYCKLFNLYFDKDPIEKVVTIRQRKNFYDGTIIDLESKIDRSKSITIKPIAFDAKWYDFNYTEADKSEFAEKYNRNWGTDYGKQKVNTGYNFDNSSNDLLEGNIYVNALDGLEMSKYFQAKVKNNAILPNWLQEWSDFKLFYQAAEGSGVESSENFYVGLPTGTTTVAYNNFGLKYDNMPKLQLHNAENKAIDGSNILLFFNGLKYTHVQGRNLSYYITDDTPAMLELNGNKSCWLSTTSTTDRSGNVIARQFQYNHVPMLPQFLRMEVVDNKVIKTFDFGKANEIYIPGVAYDEGDVTIYHKYWQKYIEDLYDRTTRVVNCYVKLDGKVEGDWLKHFYYFDNSIWCLTKIEDYNITTFETTKCEFAKVCDIEDYRS